MAEAWRVLRAQIARGDRIPAAEHDAFSYQVVSELLEPGDFGDRYLHGKGRGAITALNGYLGDRESLPRIRNSIAQQERVIQFFRGRNHGLPSQEEWKELWDDYPAIFSATLPGSARLHATVYRAQRIWKVVSSFWNDARGR